MWMKPSDDRSHLCTAGLVLYIKAVVFYDHIIVQFVKKKYQSLKAKAAVDVGVTYRVWKVNSMGKV